MRKKYVVKDFQSQSYYCGEQLGWSNDQPYLADFFKSVDDAEDFITTQTGKFTIETVYEP